MYKPVITKEKVKTIYENRFLKAYDLQYEEGKHYYVASRRALNELTAIMNDDEIKNMVPDAVSCAVILIFLQTFICLLYHILNIFSSRT